MIGSIPVRFRRITSELKKYWLVCNDEGLPGLIWSGKDLLRKIRKAFFSTENFYVYEMDLGADVEIPMLQSKVEGLLVKPVFLPISLQEYEYLGNEGVDFEKMTGAMEYGSGMHDGTIVFLTFKDRMLMNRTGMTLYKNGAYTYCCPSREEETGTVYAGFSETMKAARNLGIYSFVHSYIFNYLKQMGFKRVVLLESEEQPGPRKVQDKLGAKVLYTIRCTRILLLLNYWTSPRYIRYIY